MIKLDGPDLDGEGWQDVFIRKIGSLLSLLLNKSRSYITLS
jgi:hypothetical protein